jgi:hypothetical protein
MSTILSLRRIPHEINRNIVADKNSRRVSIPKNSVSVSSFFLVMILSLLPNISNGDDKRFEDVKRSTSTRASTSAEVKIGDLYAVVVGVSNYKDSRVPPLAVSDKDARSFAEFLSTQKNLFNAVHVSLLVNEDATREKLEKEFIYKLRRAGKDDTVIIFLSGHGVDDPKNPGEFFFLPYDADPEYVAIRGVHMNRQWFMDRLDSKRVLIIADACHAGGFSKRGAKHLAPSLDKFISQFRESEGRVFITSSRSDEYSMEEPKLGHSLFTHFLLEGLAGAATKDQDGIITLGALYEYVYKKTKAASEGFQSPQMEGRIIGTFPMALAKDYSGPESQIGPPEVRLTKRTGSQAVKARISLIDDQAKIFINGREVLVGNWGRGERGVPIGHQPGDTGIEDIAHFFHRGANEVRFWLWNDAVCCDVSAKFEISVNDNPLMVEKIQRKDSSAGVKFDKTFIVVLDETGTFIVQR